MEELTLLLGYADWKAETSIAVDDDGTRVSAKEMVFNKMNLFHKNVCNPVLFGDDNQE